MSLSWLSLLQALLGYAALGPYVEWGPRMVSVVGSVLILLAASHRRRELVLAFAFGAVAAARLGSVAPLNDGPVKPVRAMFELQQRLDERRVVAWIRVPDEPPGRWQLSGLPDSLQSGARGVIEVRPLPVVSKRNPDDRDRRRQLLGRRVRAQGYVPKGRIWIVDAGRAASRRSLRDQLIRRWRSRWGEVSPLWEALLLGDRAGLGRAPQRLFARLGLAHLLALSGLHVGIVTALLLWPMRRWGRRGVLWLLPILLLWAWLAGLSSSLLRAVGMLGWWAVGRQLRRPTRVLDGLATVAVIEMAWRPAALISVGWWLSYAATTAILRGAPVWSRWPRLAAALGVSAAAQLATLPWVLSSFGFLAWASAPLLLVVGPLFGAVLGLGLAAILIMELVPVPGLHLVLALASHLLGASLALAARWMPAPWGHPGFHGASWALALVVVALLLPPWRARARVRWALAALLLVGVHLPQAMRGGAEWVSLDVGQGDAAVYRAGAYTLLVDAGTWSARYDSGERVILPYLVRRNLREADLLITHGHLDHSGGARALLQSGRVGRLLVAASDRPEEWVEGLRRVCEEQGVRLDYVALGDTLSRQPWPVVCLWPPPGIAMENPNSRSVVLVLGPPDATLLATGDLERDAERAVLRRWPQMLSHVRVLKVAHHGGNTGTDGPWLNSIPARLALVSCGRDNRYGHPHPELLDRLQVASIRWRRTDRSGAILIRWNGAGAPRWSCVREEEHARDRRRAQS